MIGMLDRLKRAWERSADLHDLRAGATDVEIEEFETRAGWVLPSEYRALYRFANGAELFQGNLKMYPLIGNEFSVLQASAEHRAWDWPVPDELWLIGDDGQGDPFGIWLPAANQLSAPIVALGQIFEPGCLAIAGSSLEAFLLARSAFYLQLCEAPEDALDEIEIPAELRAAEPDDELWSSLGDWADPHRPGSDDPYTERLDRAKIASLFADAV